MIHNSFKLAEIVNIKTLQIIQDKFTELTMLAAVITDADGQPVTVPSNFRRICRYIRSSPEGYQRCMESDAIGGREALRQCKPYVYTCHAGLADLAAPIIVDNQYIGVFLCGQVFLPEQFQDKLVADFMERNSYLGLDEAVVEELLREVTVISEENVKTAAEFLLLMTNYIVEMGIANIMQQQLMAEMKAKSELEKLLRESEYKALQAQVNPHFLFNSLNTIARLAYMEGASKTEIVVYSLADLLRNSLKNVDVISTIGEEIRYVKEYILIQEIRFGDRIKFRVNVDDVLINAKIPNMVLQPLVENAIIHGLDSKGDGGILNVSVTKAGECMECVIFDNGVGIPSELLEVLHKHKSSSKSGQITGLGITNVHRRIQYYFGEDYGVSIESERGTGTKVKVKIPYIE